LAAANSGIETDASKPYAELWMGTHPSGPSVLKKGFQEGKLLKEYLQEHPDLFGEPLTTRFGKDLPFLFKVLSVAKALSIQAHPDKKLAEQLHAERPTVYKDDNHKPEMTLALTEFEALCQFVTGEELKDALDTVPELRTVVGEPESAAFCAEPTSKAALAAAFRSLMTADPAQVKEQLDTLIPRLQAKGTDATPKEALIVRLHEQYPGDVGVLSAYFLNYLTLKAGQGIYLSANEPHAYLSGECVECMATSDNVVRAGLTPKLRDTEVLCSMLTYNQGLPHIYEGDVVDEHTRRYSTPSDEFEVEVLQLAAGESHSLPAKSGASIMLVYEGATTASSHGRTLELATGDVYLIPANIAADLKCTSDTRMFRCSASSRVCP